MGIRNVTIFGDSQLVINQVKGQYKCGSVLLVPYLVFAQQLLQEFQECTLHHIPREENHEANRMAQAALGYRPIEDEKVKIKALKARTLPSIFTRQLGIEIFTLKVGKEDWRSPIILYLRSPSDCTNNALKLKARRYVLMEEDECLFKHGADGILLKCISTEEAIQVMAEVHEGICGAHQSEIKMKWLIHRYGYYWPKILKECIEYAHGCEACQKHGPLPRLLAAELSSIIKPWSFSGWAMDLIGKVRPTSKKRNCFVIVATDYFTKWVEAKAYKDVTEYDVIKFIKEMIVHRFGLPQSITVDNGMTFNGSRVLAFAQEYGIKILNFTPYYLQANGQAESTNKIIKKPI
jgi:hypothetical protein